MAQQLTYDQYIQQRQILGEILPLKMPLAIQIQVTNLCNFRCFYCSASQPIEFRQRDGLLLENMRYEDYKLCINSIVQSGGTEVLNLLGWGEPLLHPNIVGMVRYAKEKNAAKLIRIITNGSLLTPDLSDELIAAGLDDLRISLQGVSKHDYSEISNVDIDFEKFVENIKYFYAHRKHTTVTLKIMDIMIQGKEEEFDRIFSNICDKYLIDSLVDMNDSIDVHGHGSALNKTFLCGEITKSEICSAPFFRGYIDVDCKLFPCCHLPIPCKFGDVREDFYSVWNGDDHIQFLVNQLTGKHVYEECRTCKMYLNQLLPTERLDDFRSELISKYKKLLNVGD